MQALITQFVSMVYTTNTAPPQGVNDDASTATATAAPAYNLTPPPQGLSPLLSPSASFGSHLALQAALPISAGSAVLNSSRDGSIRHTLPFYNSQSHQRDTPSPPHSVAITAAASSTSWESKSMGKLKCEDSLPSVASVAAEEEEATLSEFEALLSPTQVGMSYSQLVKELGERCWLGCPSPLRGRVWRLVSGYTPAGDVAWIPFQMAPPPPFVIRKRQDFIQGIRQASRHASRAEAAALAQIKKDIPRCGDSMPYLKHHRVQETLERVLLFWSTRHPASRYVQGMAVIIAPFVGVVLAERALADHRTPAEHLMEMELDEVEELLSEANISVEEWREEVEPDAYWLSSYLLDVMQGCYAHQQEGFLAMSCKMSSVVHRADPQLYEHLTSLGVEPEQFAFRWMACLLMRELQPWQSLLLLDAYISLYSPLTAVEDNEDLMDAPLSSGGEETGTVASSSQAGVGGNLLATHTFTCAALLLRYSKTLIHINEFSALTLFLQRLPTEELSRRDMMELLSMTFLLAQLYGDSSA